MKKLLLFVIVMLLSVGIAQAALTDELVDYYSFDDGSLNSDSSNSVLTKTGSPSNTTGFINEAYNFTAQSQYFVNASGGSHYATATVNMWLYWRGDDSRSTYNYFAVGCPTWPGTDCRNIGYPNAANSFRIASDADGGCFADTGFSNSNEWFMATVVFNSSGAYIYINGTLNGTNTTAGCQSGVDLPNQFSRFALRDDDWFNGLIDEYGQWNRSLTPDEIIQLFNSGNGYAYPFAPITTDVNFTLTDAWNGSIISNFTVNISWTNGTVQTETTTTGGVFLTNVSDTNTNVNVSYYGMTDYFNASVTNASITANTTNTVTTTTYQSILNVFAREKISNLTVNGATYYIGATGSSQRFNITADTHTVTFTHPAYYNLSDTVTTTALTTTNTTVSGVYFSLVNVSAYYANGTSLTNFGLNVTSQNVTNWTGEVVETTNGTTWYNLINGTYSATINSTEGNQTFSFTVDDTTENIAFYYFSIDNCSTFTETMLNFTVLKESDDTLLNNTNLSIWVNASSDFLAVPLQFNFSFFTGNYYALCVPNNTVSNWTINAQAEYSNLPTYAEKNYWFVNYPLNSSPTNINLYLTNNTAQLKLQLRDFNDDAISDAYISVLSYDLGTNSYRTTEIVKTDSSGDAYAQIVQNTAWYAFLVEYDGDVILQTLPTKITSTTLTLRADLQTDYFASYDVVQGITSDLTFNNATTTFSFTWSDPTGSTAQGCLELTRISINGETELNSSCVTSSAATLLMNITDVPGTNTYKADGYAVVSGQNFHLQTLSVTFNSTFKTFGLSGIFLSMLVILTLVLVGLWHPVAAVILMVVGVVTTNVMSLFYMNWTYLITFVILAGITIYRTGRSD